ncbi:MAG: ribosome biogenesis GTPase Der [Chloroflexota bacterium]
MARSIVALVGRPNVGKSSLFNRLTGERRAVIHDVPGTTRDRLYGTAEWNGQEFTVVDTGGIELEPEGLPQEIRAQAEEAMREADIILFVVDVMTGVTATDAEVADLLRRTDKPLLLVANKADNVRRVKLADEFYELGMGEPYAISALHGMGTGDMLDEVITRLPREEFAEPDENTFSVAIVGRPNVGKSSLLNAILGEQRVIVSPTAGTTRDAIDTELEYGDERVVLIDTAGLRRRGRIEPGVEKFSVLRSVRAIERCDVAVLVIDADDGVTAQDAHVAGYVQEAMKGLLVVLNKWDLIEKVPTVAADFTSLVKRELNFVDYAPLLFLSALSGRGTQRVLPAVKAIADQRRKRVPTAELNDAMREAFATHPLNDKGKPFKLFYVTQPQASPPTFLFFVNDPRRVHFSYIRYLENQIREHFGFEGTAIKIAFRGRGEPKK